MGSTLTTYDALLKERYMDPSIVEKLVYPDNVLFGKLEQRGDTGMVGDVMPVPIFYGNPQGLGGTFSTAQTNASNTKSFKWNIQAGEYFGVVQIGDKVLMASRNNQGAFLENKRMEIDGLWEQAGENESIACWGNGGYALGRRASASSNDITLTSPEQAANFEVGMTVGACANDGSTSTDTFRTGTTTVSAINRATGVITLTNASAIGSFTDGDFLFRESDFFGTLGNVIIKGVQAFVPALDASQPDLWGVTSATRATDVQRFGGCRVDPTLLVGKTYEERIKILLAQMTGRFKAKAPTAGFMHPEDFQTLETLMGSRGIRPLEDDSTKFGYMKIDIMTGSGRIPIYSDRHCPKGNFFAFRMEDWWISSMGELFHPQDGDGLEVLRRATSTDYEYRLLSYPLLACRAPKNSGRCSLI
jgi:hypothetical protein